MDSIFIVLAHISLICVTLIVMPVIKGTKKDKYKTFIRQ